MRFRALRQFKFFIRQFFNAANALHGGFGIIGLGLNADKMPPQFFRYRTRRAGADLKAVAAEQSFKRTAPMGPSWLALKKPSIAAVEGNAVAGGLELSVLCDLRIAAHSAVFGVYCRRWGVPLIDGGTVRLPRLIGQSRAMDMILTGRPVGAEEALSFGLANRLVDDGTALDAALEMAEQLAGFPQECMRNDRLSAIEQWGLPLQEALQFEAEIGVDSLRAGATDGAARFAGGKGRSGDFGGI